MHLNMREQQYSKAFTLVELLIVMGILAVLMTIGIAVGRFAVQRSNDIKHMSAADELSSAIVAFYNDNRKYPNTLTTAGADPESELLDEYIDDAFDGGSDASYYYDTNTTAQTYIICVTLGGLNDETRRGVYCAGNGFRNSEILNATVTANNLTPDTGSNDVVNEAPNTGRSTMDWTDGYWANITTKASE